jgi:hypothetical protein
MPNNMAVSICKPTGFSRGFMTGWSEDAATPLGDTPEGLLAVLQMTTDATKKEILEFGFSPTDQLDQCHRIVSTGKD